MVKPYQCNLGQVLHNAGQSDLAIEQLKKALEMDPNFNYAHIELRNIYHDARKYDLAMEEWKKYSALNNDPEEVAIAAGLSERILATLGWQDSHNRPVVSASTTSETVADQDSSQPLLIAHPTPIVAVQTAVVVATAPASNPPQAADSVERTSVSLNHPRPDACQANLEFSQRECASRVNECDRSARNLAGSRADIRAAAENRLPRLSQHKCSRESPYASDCWFRRVGKPGHGLDWQSIAGRCCGKRDFGVAIRALFGRCEG